MRLFGKRLSHPAHLGLCSLLIAVSAVLIVSEVRAEPYTLRIENVIYHILKDRTRLNKFAHTYAKVLHAVFMEESERMYGDHRDVPPPRYRVVLAESAATLARETGAPWFTAGLYDPARDIFFFQNPMRLQERGILRKTVAHELCHQVVVRAQKQSALKAREREVWLEESYCEAHTASGVGCGRVSAEVSRVVREAETVIDLRRVIEAKSDRASALKGLCLARLWGAHLTSRYGRREVFRWMTTDRTEEIEKIPAKIETAFTDFKAKFQ